METGIQLIIKIGNKKLGRLRGKNCNFHKIIEPNVFAILGSFFDFVLQTQPYKKLISRSWLQRDRIAQLSSYVICESAIAEDILRRVLPRIIGSLCLLK